MSNNLACYPLLRPGRNIDILIAFDSSAEIQTANWIGYAEGYAKQRKIQGWPVAIGWPKGDNKQSQQELEDAQAHSAKEAQQKLEEAQREASKVENEKPLSQRKGEQKEKNALGYCTVWVGSKEERDSENEPPPSKAVEDDWELMKPNAGAYSMTRYDIGHQCCRAFPTPPLCSFTHTTHLSPSYLILRPSHSVTRQLLTPHPHHSSGNQELQQNVA